MVVQQVQQIICSPALPMVEQPSFLPEQVGLAMTRDCKYACLGAGRASRSMQTMASSLRVGVDQLQLCMPAAQGHIARLHAVVNPHEPPHP